MSKRILMTALALGALVAAGCGGQGSVVATHHHLTLAQLIKNQVAAGPALAVCAGDFASGGCATQLSQVLDTAEAFDSAALAANCKLDGTVFYASEVALIEASDRDSTVSANRDIVAAERGMARAAPAGDCSEASKVASAPAPTPEPSPASSGGALDAQPVWDALSDLAACDLNAGNDCSDAYVAMASAATDFGNAMPQGASGDCASSEAGYAADLAPLSAAYLVGALDVYAARDAASAVAENATYTADHCR